MHNYSRTAFAFIFTIILLCALRPETNAKAKDAVKVNTTTTANAATNDKDKVKMVQVALRIIEVSEKDYQENKALWDCTDKYLDKEEFTQLITSMAQKRSFDILSLPSVTVNSGDPCVIDFTRKITYKHADRKENREAIVNGGDETHNCGITFKCAPKMTGQRIAVDGQLNIKLPNGNTKSEVFDTLPLFDLRQARIAREIKAGQSVCMWLGTHPEYASLLKYMKSEAEQSGQSLQEPVRCLLTLELSEYRYEQ